MEQTVAVLLLIWLLLSALNQFPFEVNTAIRRVDLFHLVPRWHFFAPKPAVFDFHVAYRLFASDRGVLHDWALFSDLRGRTLLASLWNPSRRLRKLRIDAAQSLLRTAHAFGVDGERSVILTLPYLLLLNSACNCSVNAGASFVQFAVLQTHGFESDKPLKVLVRSELHAIDAGNHTDHIRA